MDTLERPRFTKGMYADEARSLPPLPSGIATHYDPVEPYLRQLATTYRYDPLGLVLEIFPWGKEGTFLAKYPTIEDWQHGTLADIGEQLLDDPTICRVLIASGRGVGKTGLLAMLYLWHVATHEHSATVLSATTGRQISDRPWREIGKWLRYSTLAPYFTRNATKLAHVAIPEWYGVNLTANPEKPESFQGFHEEYVGFFIDEASGMADSILETIEDGLTDPHCFVCYTSNPTRQKGHFARLFSTDTPKPAQLLYHVDGRDVSFTNKSRIAEQLADAGGDENATRFRVNVRGLFPLVGHDQFIDEWIIESAQQREVMVRESAPITIGVDVARFGSNKTVFVVRQDNRILEIQRYPKQEITVSADRLMELLDRYQGQYQRVSKVDAYIDIIGYGAGVYAICEKYSYPVHEVDSSASARTPAHHGNVRMELWDVARTWLKDEGYLDPTYTLLATQLGTPTYYFREGSPAMWLESKKDLEDRNEPSPDEADAFVYTFHKKGISGRTVFV